MNVASMKMAMHRDNLWKVCTLCISPQGVSNSPCIILSSKRHLVAFCSNCNSGHGIQINASVVQIQRPFPSS